MSKVISLTKRKKLNEKYGNVCQICNKDISNQYDLCIEHVIPKSKGGTNHIENLSIACRTCNTKKGVKNSNDISENSIFNDIDFYINLINYEIQNDVFDKKETYNHVKNILNDYKEKIEKLEELLFLISSKEGEL